MAISWQPEMLSWSLSRNTTAAIACGMAVLVFIGLNTSRSQFWMKETNDKIAHIEQMQGDTGSLQAEVIDAHVHARDYVITGEKQFLKFYLSAKADSHTKLDKLRRVELATAEAKHQQHFILIDAQVKAQFQWLQQMVDASRTGMTDAARNNMIGHADGLLNDLRTTLGQTRNEDHQLAQQLQREAEGMSRFVGLTTFTGTLASLLIFLSVIFRLNSAVNERERTEETLSASEAFKSSMIDNSNDCIKVLNRDGLLKYMSLGGQRLLEIEDINKYLDKSWIEFWNGEDQKAAREAVSKAAQGEIGNFQGYSPTEKGTPKWWDIIITPIRGADGAVNTLLAVSRDITERKRAENKLAESEQHSRAVTESANDAIITAADAGNIIGWNAAAGRMFGYTEAEIIGQPLTVLMPERFRNLHKEGLARVVAGGAPHLIGKTVEVAGLRKDGSEFPLEISLAQWQAAEGQFFTAIIHDITERKQTEQALQESESKYRRLIENSPDMGGITTPEHADVAISSLIDTCLFVRDLESGGELNRGLYILKSRGMAHSNQIREFMLTDHGVELRDLYAGEGEVLTGAARQTQEAQEKAAQLVQQQEVERRQSVREYKRKALEAQIAALRAEFEVQETESLKVNGQEKMRDAQLVQGRVEMKLRRKADVKANQLKRGSK